MRQEKQNSTEFVQEVRSFIAENYPYDEECVDDVIEDTMIEIESGNYRLMAAYLMKRSLAAAKDHGITKISDEDHPRYHVPTLIAAVKKLESEFSPEDRKMTLPLEIRYLAIAGFTQARNLSTQGRVDLGAFVAAKAIELSRYSEELKRMPEYDKFFHKTR